MKKNGNKKSKTKKSKACKHTWHFVKLVERWNEGNVELDSIVDLIETQTYARFICDKCGEGKDTLVVKDKVREIATKGDTKKEMEIDFFD